VWYDSPSRAQAATFWGFEITHGYTTLDRTPLYRDRFVAENCTWQHTTFTRDRHPCLRQDSNSHPSKRAAAGLTLYTAWQPRSGHYNSFPIARQPPPPNGPWPPHCRGFTIKLRHTTRGRAPLGEWSAQRRDLFLTTNNTHKRHTSGIWSRNPSKWAGADLLLRPRGHQDRAIININLTM